MTLLECVPRIDAELTTAWVCAEDPMARGAADALRSELASGRPFRQCAWMGRSCFRYRSDGTVESVKGIGPSAGSEWMRRLIDNNLRRSYGGAGGCLRLESGSSYPLLVPFGREERAWRILSSRPEGMSRFELCLLEAEAALLYRGAGIPTPIPSAVLRARTSGAWFGGEQGMRAHLNERMPGAIRDHLRIERSEPEPPLRIERQAYADLERGLLGRRMLSPFRIANLQQAIVERDRGALRGLVLHMTQVLARPAAEIGSAFVSSIAGTAARLFAEGVVHGQLHIHHQDVTLAGELADLDCTVLLRSLPPYVEDVPLGPSRLGSSYVRHRAKLRDLEHRHGCRLLDDMDTRYEGQFVGTGATSRWRRTRIGAALLRQLFDLWNQGALTADRVLRFRCDRLEAPGTVLPDSDWAELRNLFADRVARHLAATRALDLFHWCGQHAWDYLVEVELCPKRRRTLYGWWLADLPPNFVDLPGDEARAAAVQAEATSFFQAITDAARSQRRSSSRRATSQFRSRSQSSGRWRRRRS